MKEFRRGEPEGWCCGDTKQMLRSVIRDIDPKNIAEIGSFKGMSAHFMCRESEAHIYCIDHWEGSPEHKNMDLSELYQTFLDNTEEFKDRITPIKLPSDSGLRKLHKIQPNIDMIFIDGDHSYSWVTHDISLAHNLFPNAVLCGDDYTLSSVCRAVEDMSRELSLDITLFNERAWRLCEKQ